MYLLIEGRTAYVKRKKTRMRLTNTINVENIDQDERGEKGGYYNICSTLNFLRQYS